MRFTASLLLFVALQGIALQNISHAQETLMADVLIPGEGWQLVGEGYKFTEGPAADAAGNVYFTDIPNSRIHKIDLAGKVTVFAENTNKSNGLMFGPDGKLYGCKNGARQIVAWDAAGKETVIASEIDSNDLVVLPDGSIYVTDPPNKQLWSISPKGEKSIAAKDLAPNGVIYVPGTRTLVVTDGLNPQLWAFQVGDDGKLTGREPYYRPLQMPPVVLKADGAKPAAPERTGADGMTVDEVGRVYVTTRMGLQMFDPTGRLCGTFTKPQKAGLSNVCFGGPEHDTLFVTSVDKVYKRKIKAKGYLVAK